MADEGFDSRLFSSETISSFSHFLCIFEERHIVSYRVLKILKNLKTMKICFFLFLMSLCPGICSESNGDEHGGCTKGRLFVSSDSDTNVRVYDLHKDEMPHLHQTVSVPRAATPEIVLATSSTTEYVSAIYRGQENQLYQDGTVSFIDAGISLENHGDHNDLVETDPVVISNADISCARPIHFEKHDQKIAVFCDGVITPTDLINTTIWVVDEEKLGQKESAIIFNITLESSHHGVAVAVDDVHLLHSIALPERIAGDSSRGTALPGTFQVINMKDGSVVHPLTDTSDPSKSCAGYHGSWAMDNTFLMACDDDHGGILVLNYDPTAISYSSRTLLYPAEYPEHRTGNFAHLDEHHKSPRTVGSFASTTEYHLVAFEPDATALTEDNIQTVGSQRQCGYKFEMSEGQLMVVLVPDGTLKVYHVHPVWELLAEMTVVPEMDSCDGVTMIVGVGEAFIMKDQSMFIVDLAHAEKEGKLEVESMDLDFTPFSAVIAGVPPGGACEVEDHSTSTATPGFFSFYFVATALSLLALIW